MAALATRGNQNKRLGHWVGTCEEIRGHSGLASVSRGQMSVSVVNTPACPRPAHTGLWSCRVALTDGDEDGGRYNWPQSPRGREVRFPGVSAPLDRPDPAAFNLDRDRALEKGNGNDQAQLLLEADNDAFDVLHAAVFDPHALADTEEGPGPGRESGPDDGLDGGDLGLVHRFGRIAHAYDVHDTRGGQNGETPVGVEAAEDIAGEQGEFDLFQAVGPAALGEIEGRELLETLAAKDRGRNPFVIGTDTHREPRIPGRRTSGAKIGESRGRQRLILREIRHELRRATARMT